jgi:predicted metal-dependent phosphoesterase TrpH
MHSAEDDYDVIVPSAREVIDRAHRFGFDVIAITNHMAMCYSAELAEYAEKRGILLVPGAEIEAGGRHILLLNPTKEALKARTFDELRVARAKADREMAVVAPHPFFPSHSSLGRLVIDHVDVFDALEHCAFYFRGLNYNRITKLMARRLRLPLVANSDAHYSWQFGRTYSLIKADKTIEGVIKAVKKGALEIVSRPLPWNKITIRLGLRGLRIPEYLLWKEWREGDSYWDCEIHQRRTVYRSENEKGLVEHSGFELG